MVDDSIDIRNDSKKSEISSIKNMVTTLELKLKGYVWDSNGNKMVYVGEPLATSKIINSATTLLQSFCANANLITDKEKLTLFKQKWETNSTFNRVLARNIGENTDNYDVIMKSFKSTLQNIFDIIMSSKDLMRSFYGAAEEQEIEKPFA